MGVNEGGKGGGGGKGCARNGWWCHKRVSPPPPLAPVLRRAPVQHSIGRRVFRHMVV